jgi:nucleotide-binding universal stress UspA family protein
VKLLKTILVAVDFDDTLDAILAVAGSVATKLGSDVVLTHVVEAADDSGEAPQALGNSITDRLGAMQKHLTASGVRVPQVLCLSGKAAVEIVDAAPRLRRQVADRVGHCHALRLSPSSPTVECEGVDGSTGENEQVPARA